MSKKNPAGNCWAVRDPDGNPRDDEWDPHYDAREGAETAIGDLRDDDFDEDETPEQEAARIAEQYGEEAGRRALVVARRHAERLASLRPVELPGPCYKVECDGPGCGEEPEGEYGGHLHFRPGDEFDPPAFDFCEVGGQHFCDDCKLSMVCLECDGLSGEGARDRDGMCPGCWEQDQRKPGEGQLALATEPSAVTK